MKTLETIKAEISELNKNIHTLKEEMKASFNTNLSDLLDKHSKKFDCLTIGLNNHEFNDGDATYFGLHIDDMTLTYSDELGNEYEQSSCGDTDNPEMEKIREEFIKLFESYDVDSFYESLYGDEYESVTISAH